ncbi:MAG TPA: glycosyltransferase, partial [Tepidisphaeraceae bacterium]|nr:glycosyltransferase [Tepidisphaeraceae bacterium]
MVRVLVIHQPTGDFENRALVAALSSLRSPGHELHCVKLPPSGAMPQSIARIMRLDRSVGFEVIHAIGPSSLLAALPVGCQPIIYTPPAADPLRGLRRVRWMGKVRQVTVAAPSQAVARELVRAGVARERIRVVFPPYTPNTTGAVSRSNLGFTDDDRILLAVGECTRRAGHKLTAWAAVILFCFDPRYKLLVAGGPYSETIRRFAAGLNQTGFCTFAHDALGYVPAVEDLVPLANVALFTPAEAHGLLAAQICQAGNLPIIASPHDMVCELLHAPRMTISQSRRAKIIAQAVFQHFDSNPAAAKA